MILTVVLYSVDVSSGVAFSFVKNDMLGMPGPIFLGVIFAGSNRVQNLTGRDRSWGRVQNFSSFTTSNQHLVVLSGIQ